MLHDGAHQKAGSSNGDDDEHDPNNRGNGLEMTRRRRTLGNHDEQDDRPSRSGPDHVGAGLLRLPAEPEEQENEEDDRRGGWKWPARERGVTKRGARQEKPDRGEYDAPVHT